MKTIKLFRNLLLLLITFFFVMPPSSNAQNADKANIETAIEKYILGWRKGDVKLLKEAFDLDAGVVLWIDKKAEPERLNSMTLSDLLQRQKPHEDYGIGYKIKKVDIIDSQLAMAKVKIPLPSKNSYYIDFLQLQKINGQWKIVLKSFVYFPKA